MCEVLIWLIIFLYSETKPAKQIKCFWTEMQLSDLSEVYYLRGMWKLCNCVVRLIVKQDTVGQRFVCLFLNVGGAG